jgi:hypothetical protein
MKLGLYVVYNFKVDQIEKIKNENDSYIISLLRIDIKLHIQLGIGISAKFFFT